MTTGFIARLPLAPPSKHGQFLRMCSASAGPSEPTVSRRTLFGGAFAAAVSIGVNPRQALAVDVDDRQKAIEDFERVTELQKIAFEYTDRGEFPRAEKIWTRLISLKEDNAAAWSNRGNCRTSQGKFLEAIEDFNKAIELAGDEPDPYLGRGVAFEGLGRFEEAVADDITANEKSIARYGTDDAVAWNNRGNAQGGLNQWQDARDSYRRAQVISPNYTFARANEALARYQLGDMTSVIVMQGLVRKFSQFADVHAALAAVYWASGDPSAAENSWNKAVSLDSRYKDIEWVSKIRRWPPRLVNDLQLFLELKRPVPVSEMESTGGPSNLRAMG